MKEQHWKEYSNTEEQISSLSLDDQSLDVHTSGTMDAESSSSLDPQSSGATLGSIDSSQAPAEESDANVGEEEEEAEYEYEYNGEVYVPWEPYLDYFPEIMKYPDEILTMIMERLDTLAQVCLSLTNRRMNRILHEIFGGKGVKGRIYDKEAECLNKRVEVWWDGEGFDSDPETLRIANEAHSKRWKEGVKGGWDIVRYPFSLRMRTIFYQGSTTYMFHWNEFLEMRNFTGLKWSADLATLLRNEKWLWGKLWFCEHCFKYKPRHRFSRFRWERKILKKYKKKIKRMDRDGRLGSKYIRTWYCRRCRAKEWSLLLEEREEFFEEDKPWDFPDSLGLWKLTPPEDTPEIRRWQTVMTNHEICKSIGHFDTWEEFWAEIGI